MNSFRILFSLSPIMLFFVHLSAQVKDNADKYTNQTFVENIKTVRLFPKDQEGEFPAIRLNSKEQLSLSFDDLSNTIKDYYISIEHCDANWTKSDIPTTIYLNGINEEIITNIQSSFGTLQPYYHYQIDFPNHSIKPKIAGNYILKIYEASDPNEIVVTQKFYVFSRSVQTQIQDIPSAQSNRNENYQKLNINVKTNIPINNPNRDLQVLILQNQRYDNMQSAKKPSFIGLNEYRFDAIETFNFNANNELRLLDLRNINGGSTQIKSISKDRTLIAQLFTDLDYSDQNYVYSYDHNGKFFIRNLDNEVADITSDYINTIFSLKTSSKINGNIYLVGKFNDFNQNQYNKLEYNTIQDTWECSQYLKQGLYDYEYILVDQDGKIATDTFSGNHYATKNEYQVLVYLRKMGTTWDEIIDFKTITIHNK